MKKLITTLTMIVFVLLNHMLYAQTVPNLIDYQGKLSDSDGNPLNEDVSITFSIYSAANGGIALWSETQDPVYVNEGIFHVLLGSANPLPEDLFDQAPLWLGIDVNDDGEMLPRNRLASVPFAMKSASSSPDDDWTISGNDIYRLNGWVGIGTDNPSSNLEVYEDIDNFVGLYITNPNTGSWSQQGIRFVDESGFGNDAGIRMLDPQNPVFPNTFNLFDYRENSSMLFQTTEYTDFVIDETGNVGIGKWNPTERLDVAGVAKASYFEGDGSGLTNIPLDDDWAVSGNNVFVDSKMVGIGTDSPATNLELSKSGENFMRITSTSNERAGLELIRPGAANYRDWRIFNDGGNLYFNVDDDEFIEDDGTNMLFMNYLNHKIGIGTDSPATNLELSKSGENFMRITSTSNERTGLELIRPGAANYRDWRIFNDGGNLYFNVDNDEFIEDDGTNMLFMNYLNHRIGIGTTEPSSKLEVAGDVKATSFTGDGSGLTNIPLDDDWLVNGENIYRQDGNVGIGVSNPSSKLEIYGDLKVHDIYSRGNNIGLYSNAEVELILEKDDWPEITSYFEVFHTTDGPPIFSVAETGKVKMTGYAGINTFTPDAWLHINDTDDENPAIFLKGASDTEGDITWESNEHLQLGRWDRQNNEFSKVMTLTSNHHLNLYKSDGSETVAIETTENGDDGSSLKLYKANGDLSIELDAEYGGAGGDSRIRTDVLRITGGSDLAEPFNIKESNVEKGMVLSIDPDHPGQLKLSDKSYDRCVAGIASGAGGINAGMIMGQDESIADGNVPVALTGRVYCWVDATKEPVQPGDLLTTSDTPGHAMKVVEHENAQGAIIGKAMSSLESGKGLVLVLVTLQ